ncbi:hypothetical protein TSAR_001312 [Trichomalopsis sarcophagae]|uniref:Endonuclease/exonuclease/phosphatase domain-containing protein n=1 Tax=Trichomalopsis sarcophagae TaxID=543379 RepID=A0A232FJP3_9HYME|nr:hypothetical protein TSAR_001312 [Trichomalopsis sarcophagae]
MFVKLLDPVQLKIKTKRIHYTVNNAIVIEADDIDVNALRNYSALSKLEVKEDAKLNPRIIVHDIPVDYTKQEILKSFVELSLPQYILDNAKVVSLYLARENKCRSCILEVKPGTYQAKDCSNAPCGSHCAGVHESSKCPPDNRIICCFNCTSAKLSNVSHEALDKINCPLLRSRLERKSSRIDYGLIGHSNAESIHSHLLDLQAVARINNLHLFGICESFLKPGLSSSLVEISHFNLFGVDRLGKECGGVAIYVHKSIKVREVSRSSQSPVYTCKRPEFLFLELSFSGAKILCSTICNPPKAGYWSDVEEAIFNCSGGYDFTVLMSDFNIEWHTNSSASQTPCVTSSRNKTRPGAQ